jgi:hypothetical protein
VQTNCREYSLKIEQRCRSHGTSTGFHETSSTWSQDYSWNDQVW